MKISKKLVSFVLMLVAVVTFSFTAVTLTKAKAETAFVMDDKAVIRVIAPESEGKNTYGIGFRAKVTEPVDGAYYNMMIIPENYVDAYKTAVETKDETRDIVKFMLDKKADADAAKKNMPLAIATNLKVDQDGYITGGLVNIKYENLNVNFYGFGYYELGDEVVNATPATVDDAPTYSRRSIAEVASNAILSGDYDNATGDTLEELKDIQNIYMQSVKQNSGVEEDDAVDTAPNLTLNYSNAKTYIRGTVDLNSANGIADGLINWSSSADSVATVDADGVIVGKSAGTATITANLFGEVTATCEVTVDPVEVVKAENVSVNSESATKGSVTFTSHQDSTISSNTSFVLLHGDYTDQFLKVGFRTPKDSGFLANTLGLGARQGNVTNVSGATTLHLTMQPSQYGGGYRLCSNGQNLYIADGDDDMWTLQGANSGLAADTNYYFVYGVVDNTNGSCFSNSEKNYGIYFAILDDNNEILRTYYTTKSHAEQKDLTIGEGTDKYYRNSIADSGSFIITSALAGQSRTVTYEILEKEDAINAILTNPVAPTVSKTKGIVNWLKLADMYRYKIDEGEWIETAENSVELGVGVHTIQVQAFSNEFESAIANFAYSYAGENIILKNMTDVYFENIGTDEGVVDFTSTGTSARTDSATVQLREAFTNEFVKVKFKAKGAGYDTSGISISLRQTADVDDYLYTWTICPEGGNGAWLTRHGAKHQYYPFSMSGVNHIVGSSLGWKSLNLTVGETYYTLAGVNGTGDEAVVYFGVQDKDSKWIKLDTMPWSAIKNYHSSSSFASDELVPFANSGWLTIYDSSNLGGKGTIDYNTTNYTSDAILINAASGSTSYDSKTQTTTATIKANTGATQTANAASLRVGQLFSDKFVKVGFDGVAGSFLDQKIGVGMRANTINNAPNTAGYTILPTPHGRGAVLVRNAQPIYAGQVSGQTYTGDLVYGSQPSLTGANSFETTKYYIVAGAIGSYSAATTDAEAQDVKFYFELIKVVDGVEVTQFIIEFSFIEDAMNHSGFTYFGGAPNTTGYLTLWSWADTEKTITYQLVDKSTVLDKISAQ